MRPLKGRQPLQPTPALHLCKVEDASCCALCRQAKFRRRLRSAGATTEMANRLALGA
jgi:hypothetical protein